MNSNNVRLPRVKIIASNDYIKGTTYYLDEFIGKTGTIVWVASPIYSNYQCSVYLDKPHSIFGEFLQIGYFDNQEKNDRMQELYLEPIEKTTKEDITFMAKIINDQWGKYHTINGDPLDPELVLEKYSKDIEKVNG